MTDTPTRRPLRMLPRSRRAPDPQARYADPHPVAVLARRLARRLRWSVDAVARRGTLSIVGLGCVTASVWVAFGLAAGLAALGVVLVFTDWRIVP